MVLDESVVGGTEPISTIENNREMLRAGEVFLGGRVSTADKEVLQEVEEEVRRMVGQIDAVFGVMFEEYEGDAFADLFASIYLKMAKAHLKVNRKAGKSTLTEEELKAFWTEVQEVISLFNQHGVRVDVALLEPVMTNGGLAYWREFFEGEFASFVSSPSIVFHAARHYKDPRAFLRRVEVDVAEILSEEEFAGFVSSPWIVRHAAVNNPKGPRAFLRRVEVDVAEILSEEEFAGFISNPSIVRDAAVNNKDPRAFLRRVEVDMAAILSEPEFEGFVETPSIVLHAAVSYKDPRAFLRRVEVDVAKILSEEEFEGFVETPSIVRQAAVTYPKDARAYLRKLMKERSR